MPKHVIVVISVKCAVLRRALIGNIMIVET